jgi:hypothetical protein
MAQGAVWLWRQHLHRSSAPGSDEEKKAAAGTTFLEPSGLVFSIALLVLGLALLVSMFEHPVREWRL